MLYLFYIFGLFYQDTKSAPAITEPASAEPKGIGEYFSSSLYAVSFVGRPLLMTSLSLAFHLLRFSSPQIYLLSGNMCIHKYAKWTLYNMKKFWWQPYSLFRRDCIVNIFLSCVQYPRLTMICSILSSCCHQTFLWLGAISDEEFGHFYA